MAEKGKKRILAANAEAAKSAEIEKFLKNKGYAVKTAATAKDAIALVQTWKPHLILLDILGESFNAIDFISDIKKSPFTENQKIIIFSLSPEADMLTGPAAKAKAFLTKPLEFEILKAELLRALPQKQSGEPPTVLIADPDKAFTELICRFLEANNYKPLTLNPGTDIFELVKTTKPDLVLLDLLLYPKNGFSAITALANDTETKNIPVIVVTNLRFNNFQESGPLTGLPEILASPLPADLLHSIIEQLIGRGLENGQNEIAKPQKPKLLLADDQTELLTLMKETIEAAGFDVLTATDGKEALKLVFEEHPDIAVLDYKMPGKDGLAVAAEMKNNPLLAHIPIIICTGVSEKKAKLQGLGMGIDDYLIKPVDTEELVARVRMILKRNKQVLDTNPLSKLPGNPSIQARIESEIQKGGDFAVLYLDLNNFKAYNDLYGFEAGDGVIRSTANLLVKQTIQNENAKEFIGHIGGDDFIIVTKFDQSEELSARILKAFDEIAPSFYNKNDRERGYMISTDRQGNIKHFPFLSISIGIVHNKLRPLESFAQISGIGSELKKAAKTNEKSSCIIDRRKD